MPAPSTNRRVGVLVSGRGSNLQALIDAAANGRLKATLAVAISNHPEAGALERARLAGIDAVALSHKGWSSRDDYDRALAAELQARDVALVCLAGFLRRIGRPLLDAFPNAILNIHPSLLPSFPGLDAPGQALAHGVKVSGATVHFVDEQLDSGAIVMQRAVPVNEDDTVAALSARILVEEHRIYPEAVSQVLEGGWTIEGRRFCRAERARR